MKTYFRIMSYARPIRHYLPLYIPFIVMAMFFQMLGFAFIVPILDILVQRAEGQVLGPILRPETFEFSKSSLQAWMEYYKYDLTVPRAGMDLQDLLMWVCIYLVIVVLLSNVTRFFAQRILGSIRARLVKNIRKTLYASILNKHISYFSDQNRGDAISRLTNDVTQLEVLVVDSFQAFIREPVTIILLLFFLFTMSVKLTLISLLVLPLTAIFIAVVVKKLKDRSARSQKRLAGILSAVDETILGLKIIKAFRGDGYVKARFNDVNSDYSNTLKKIEHRRALSSPASQFIGTMIIAVVIYMGGSEVLSGQNELLSGNVFMFYIVTLAQLIAPIKGLSNGVSNIQRGIIAGERVFEIIDQKSKIQDAPDAQSFEGFKSKIEIENLKFRYDSKYVLNGVSLEINKGETVALVGPSGGGKSTLIDFIPRFHDPESGSLKIDGVDFRKLKLSSLRKLMGVVTQEAVLFNDTVYNNIAFGIDATLDEVKNAAKIANAHEFIEGLEDGYQSNVGDRGMKLSGGQRQRLTIARAILQNPPILLLDEATSALDTESERLVQDALVKLMENRTTIVIAHRLSTIQNADKIVVLREGEIIEQGNHNTLLQKDGLYKKLVSMQSA